MNPPRVSIVVPIYNKEPYLRKALASVIETSYPNKEIILVDDASTDGSPEIIREFAARHPEVMTLSHARNMRMSVARNTGLSAATGQFVHFWDADDILDPVGLEKIVSEMIEDDADIGTGIAYRDGAPLEVYRRAMVSIRRTTLSESPIAAHNDSSCFKLYRRDFLIDHGLRFAPGLFLQDIELNLRAMPLARRITVTPYRLGNYTSATGSWSKSYGVERFDSAIEVNRLTEEFYVRHGLNEYEDLRQSRILNAVFYPFLRNVLVQVCTSYRIGHEKAHFIEGPELAWRYIDRFRNETLGLRRGIAKLWEINPYRALAFQCLADGCIGFVLPILDGKRPFEGFEAFLPAYIDGPSARVAKCVAQLGKPDGRLAWPGSA